MAAFASASVTTSDGQIIPRNPSRSVYMVLNPAGSGQTVYIQEDAAAVVGAASWRLEPGDSFTGRSTAAIRAIATGAVNVTVQEY